MNASVSLGTGRERRLVRGAVGRRRTRLLQTVGATMPRVIGTRSYPSIPAPSIRRSRASIASRTNTNSRVPGPRVGIAASGARARARADMLVVDYAGGEPLDRLIRQPMEIGQFLRLAVALSGALSQLHGRGLIHKDIKPANVLVDSATGRVWLTGFGIASRLPRERQAPEPPEFIAGTLAYMAPEQTGRVNRSIDSRSDLYSLGVTFYEMLTGGLPFTASDPMEWVHCHIAQTTGRTQRATENCARLGLRDHDEAALQDGRGAVSDSGGS